MLNLIISICVPVRFLKSVWPKPERLLFVIIRFCTVSLAFHSFQRLSAT